MKKTQKGFTLVELVVVIAIIGVLAAILVPSMLNYVKKSRLKTANANAKTAYNAVAELLADAETQGFNAAAVFGTNAGATGAAKTLTDFAIQSGATYDSRESITDKGAIHIADVLKENGDESGVFKVEYRNAEAGTTTLDQDTDPAFVVFWAKSTDDAMVGEYPDAVLWDDWKDMPSDIKDAINIEHASMQYNYAAEIVGSGTQG